MNTQMSLQQRTGSQGKMMAYLQLNGSQASGLIDLISVQLNRKLNQVENNPNIIGLQKPQKVEALRKQDDRFHQLCSVYDALLMSFELPDVAGMHSCP